MLTTINLMSKKIVLVTIALVGSLFCAQAEINHNIALWLNGGATSYIDNIEESGLAIGGGGALGVGYELQVNHFLMDIGAEFQYGSTFINMNPYTVDVPGLVDSEGDQYDGHFNFHERQDVTNVGYVNVPLLFGGQFNKFYFLVGAKLGLSVLTSSQINSFVKATGTYDKFIGEFENMPNHNFGTTEHSMPSPVTFNMDVRASLELGYRIVPGSGSGDEYAVPSPVTYRIAAFCDYGVLNANSGNNTLDYATVPANGDVNNIAMNHVYMSSLAQGKMINNLFCGVKFTVLFQLPTPKNCRCDF